MRIAAVLRFIAALMSSMAGAGRRESVGGAKSVPLTHSANYYKDSRARFLGLKMFARSQFFALPGKFRYSISADETH